MAGVLRRRQRPAIAVFCSGQGTNLQAILDAVSSRRLRVRVALVISDRGDATALERARRAGVEASYIDPQAFPTRADYERALIARCESHRVRLICLAGFMWILSPMFVHHFQNRILNIHPALLPAFPGGHAVHDAMAWGAKVTGVTVHFVDERVDHGPILLQEAVTIAPHDTEATLLRKLHQVEHWLYPEAIKLCVEDRVKVVGRTIQAQ